MKKCGCHETKTITEYSPIKLTKRDKEVGVCLGMSESERCTCNGDENKCDFHKDKR